VSEISHKNYRDSASFGKRQEFVVIAELLKEGFDVYLTLVDDQGIDCIIRLDQDHYLDIQIKARSNSAKKPYRFAALQIEPRDNYFFIFYTEDNTAFWTMPSRDVIKYAYQNQSGQNAGKYAINLPKDSNLTKSNLFSKYKGKSGFDLLRTN